MLLVETNLGQEIYLNAWFLLLGSPADFFQGMK